MQNINFIQTDEQKYKLLALVMGNIATGKTTFINKLNNRVNRIIIINDNYLDVNSSDMSDDILQALFNDKTVILEGNYLSRHIRHQVINSVRNYIGNVKFICFDFGPGNKETLCRRLKDSIPNKEKIMNVYKKYRNQYQKPILQEGFSKIIKCYKE